MRGYKTPTRDEFKVEGDQGMHLPTGATWDAYEGSPHVATYSKGKLGYVLPNGDNYNEREVCGMASRLLANRPKLANRRL